MYKKVEIEVAPTSKSTCKQCSQTIEQGELRAKVVDDREFKAYLKRNPGAREGEGFSRGYFETPDGCISIQKYNVHLKCYKPIYPHPK